MPTSAPGPPPAPQAVVARGLGLVVDGARILDDVSLVLRRGERWAVLGPNGSGKTSLVRLFSAYAYPSEGTLQVLGERFGRTDLRRLRARIGWVHSDVRYQIPPFMSAAEVVMSRARGGLVLYGEVPAAALAQARRQLALLAAAHLAERRFATLSTGERQRVLIARALAPEVELLLLDEPAIGLDPAARERFLEDLAALFRQRRELHGGVRYPRHSRDHRPLRRRAGVGPRADGGVRGAARGADRGYAAGGVRRPLPAGPPRRPLRHPLRCRLRHRVTANGTPRTRPRSGGSQSPKRV